VRCAACGHALTQHDARLEVDGRHVHTFVNPHAYAFTITCWHEAPGCVRAGPSSTEWTWFPGHTWTVILCGGCAAHVGWAFDGTKSTETFVGLVQDRIAE
jgi:hypothetical protein